MEMFTGGLFKLASAPSLEGAIPWARRRAIKGVALQASPGSRSSVYLARQTLQLPVASRMASVQSRFRAPAKPRVGAVASRDTRE